MQESKLKKQESKWEKMANSPFLTTEGSTLMLGQRKILGKGSFGEVCKVTVENETRTFVIKNIQYDHDTKKDDVIKEVDCLKIFGHLVGSEYREESAALGMPYLGKDVWHLRKKLSVEAILIVIHGCLESLYNIDAAGIIHGDITLANLLYSRTQGRATLTDFGLALKKTEADLFKIRGARYTRPPEVDQPNSFPSTASSVWSAGITIVWILEYRLRRRFNLIWPEAIEWKIDNSRQGHHLSKFLGFKSDYDLGLRIALKLKPSSANSLIAILNDMLQVEPEKRCSPENLLERYEDILINEGFLREKNDAKDAIKQIGELINNIVRTLEKLADQKISRALLGTKNNEDGMMQPSCKTFYDLQGKAERFISQVNKDTLGEPGNDRQIQREYHKMLKELLGNLESLNRKKINGFLKSYEKLKNTVYSSHFFSPSSIKGDIAELQTISSNIVEQKENMTPSTHRQQHNFNLLKA